MTIEKSPKKRINSRAKGGEYERKVARTLGLWFKEEFHRVPASGGLRWGEDNRVAGDIVTPVDSLFPFTVECKKHENWDMDQILKGTGDVEKWWTQSTEDSIRVNTIPFLVFSKNFNPSFLMVSEEVFNTIIGYKGNPEVPFNYFRIHIVGKPPRVVCVLDEFTKFITREDIIGALPLKK